MTKRFRFTEQRREYDPAAFAYLGDPEVGGCNGWRPPLFEHGELGPDAEMHIDQKKAELAASGARVLCEGCEAFWIDDIKKYTEHLRCSRTCWGIRAASFWEEREFINTTLRTRFANLCARAGIEVWQDVGGEYHNPHTGATELKYVTWLPEWAQSIWSGYHCDTHPAMEESTFGAAPESRRIVLKRGLDTPNDWLMYHVLWTAEQDLEFRSAVMGMQRVTSSPHDQRDALTEWIVDRGHEKPRTFPTNRP